MQPQGSYTATLIKADQNVAVIFYSPTKRHQHPHPPKPKLNKHAPSMSGFLTPFLNPKRKQSNPGEKLHKTGQPPARPAKQPGRNKWRKIVVDPSSSNHCQLSYRLCQQHKLPCLLVVHQTGWIGQEVVAPTPWISRDILRGAERLLSINKVKPNYIEQKNWTLTKIS